MSTFAAVTMSLTPHKLCQFTADLLIRGGTTLVTEQGNCLFCEDHDVKCQVRHHRVIGKGNI